MLLKTVDIGIQIKDPQASKPISPTTILSASHTHTLPAPVTFLCIKYSVYITPFFPLLYTTQ